MARPTPDLVIELEDFEQFGQNLSNFYVINSSWGKVWELICRKVPPESQKIIKLWQFFISLLTSFELTERLVGFSSFTYKLINDFSSSSGTRINSYEKYSIPYCSILYHWHFCLTMKLDSRLFLLFNYNQQYLNCLEYSSLSWMMLEIFLSSAYLEGKEGIR